MFNINLIIDIVLDFLYPPRCAGCGKILEEKEIKSGFCKDCRAIIRLTGKTVCLKCGKPIRDFNKELCSDCEKKSHGFVQAKAIFEYYGPIKDAMYRFKYSNHRHLAKIFAKEAMARHGRWIRDIHPAAIVPVPMYRHKKRVRGYNQAELFAKELSRLCGVPCITDAVIREKNTSPLKMLSPAERRSNLKEAFKKTKNFKNNADILIVDDIYTTGTTVDEVAKVLHDAKAGKVYCLFICTGRRQ